MDNSTKSNLIEILREFRAWDAAWDNYPKKNQVKPPDVDNFINLLADQWEVRPTKNNKYVNDIDSTIVDQLSLFDEDSE